MTKDTHYNGPLSFMSEGTLTHFVVIKDLQLAMVGWGFH